MLALENKYGSQMEFVIADITKQEGNSLAEKFDIYYIPVWFVLDRQGKILDHIEFSQVQDNPQEKLDTIISEDLQKVR